MLEARIRMKPKLV